MVDWPKCMFVKLTLVSLGLFMKSSIKSPTLEVETMSVFVFKSGVVISNFKDLSTAFLIKAASSCRWKWSNNIAADKIEAIGLAIPLPVAWG